MRRLLFLAGLTAATACSAAQTQPTAPPSPTAAKLIIAISVDQFSADLFDEYRPVLLGGIGRLARGSALRKGYQGHSATGRCCGYSAIVSGAWAVSVAVG